MGGPQNAIILIVENDKRISDVTAAILTGAGYYVAQASNGVEALEVLAVAKSVSLVLTDIWMPTMHGCALIEAMRSDPSLAQVPILVTTGEVAPTGLPADVRVLRKPFQGDALIEAVTEELADASTEQ